MIFDNELLLSDDQAITATAASTNYWDRGATGTPVRAVGPLSSDAGKGNDIPVSIVVTETFNNLTSLKVDLQVDNDSAFGSPKTVQSTVVLAADLVQGKKVPPMEIPEGTDERYVRLNYTVTGVAPTTGKVNAGVVADIQSNP